MGLHLFPPLIFADAATGPAGFKQANISSLSEHRKKTGHSQGCAMPAAGKANCLLSRDFGTSDILAAVDRNCISPVRD
jgi:hypothetical protein